MVLIRLDGTLESETLFKQREFDLSCDNCENYTYISVHWPFKMSASFFPFMEHDRSLAITNCWVGFLKKKVFTHYLSQKEKEKEKEK